MIYLGYNSWLTSPFNDSMNEHGSWKSPRWSLATDPCGLVEGQHASSSTHHAQAIRICLRAMQGKMQRESDGNPMFSWEKIGKHHGFGSSRCSNVKQLSEIWWNILGKTSSISLPISNLSWNHTCLKIECMPNALNWLPVRFFNPEGLLGKHQPLTSSFKTLLTSKSCKHIYI